MKYTTKLFYSFALCGLFSYTALADPREMPVRVPSTGILPVVQGVGSLTVAGGDFWHKYRYADGEQPLLSAYDNSGQPLPDGFYRYEFVSIPKVSDSDVSAPQNSAFGATKGQRQSAQIDTGNFTVNSGVIVFN